MIQNLDRATNNNIEHQSLEFVMYTMLPWFKRWEENIIGNCYPRWKEERGFILSLKWIISCEGQHCICPNMEGQVANVLSVGVQNEGRTLSSVNEQRIRQASDLLNEVLDQLGDTGEGQDSVPLQLSLQAAALIDPPTTQ